MQKQISKKQKLVRLLAVMLVPIAGLAIFLINFKSGNTNVNKDAVVKKDAFNTRMPATNPKDPGKNKLEIYMEALKDSAKKNEWKNDSYQKRFFDPGPPADSAVNAPAFIKQHAKISHTANYVDPNEQRVNNRLEKLYATLNNTAAGNKQTLNAAFNPADLPAKSPAADVEQLQKLISTIKQQDSGSDPQIQELGKMVDKLMALQHPEHTEQPGSGNSPVASPAKRVVYKVSVQPAEILQQEPEISQVEQKTALVNGFYGISFTSDTATQRNTTVTAVIHEAKLIHNGSTIKLRLQQDIYVSGQLIPRGNFITGYCTISNERVHIQLSSMDYNDQIFPVQLTAYDTDGLEGIPVEGALSRDVAKEGLAQGTSGLGIGALDPSIGAQAAAAGIETAKTLLSRKLKLVTATIKEGHKVLLKNTQS